MHHTFGTLPFQIAKLQETNGGLLCLQQPILCGFCSKIISLYSVAYDMWATNPGSWWFQQFSVDEQVSASVYI
jgi:hypothetical protein